MKTSLQSKYVNVKTILNPLLVEKYIVETWPSASICWCTHDKDSSVSHTHFVVGFGSATRWDKMRNWLMAADSHSYSSPARSWSRSVRYLIHADNPEKFQYPASEIHCVGIDRDEVDSLVGGKTSSFVSLFNDLGAVSHLPVGQQFCQLVSKGYMPSEITQVVRCLSSLVQFRNSYQGFASAPQSSGDCVCASGVNASPDDAEDSFSSDLFGAFCSV